MRSALRTSDGFTSREKTKKSIKAEIGHRRCTSGGR